MFKVDQVKKFEDETRQRNETKTNFERFFTKKNITRFSFRLFTLTAMASLFLWQAWDTVVKYRLGYTTMQVSLQDDGKILYPSISFCKKYTWIQYLPGLLEILQANESVTEKEARDFATTNIWSRKEAFTFFNHQNAKEKSFPCTTVSGGRSSGVPCSFPFRYRDCNISPSTACSDPDSDTSKMEVYDTCTNRDSTIPWCYTRTYENTSQVIGYWSYCSTECNGELPVPSSPFNLAGSNYEDDWEQGLVNMDTWSGGYCHTYNPSTTSEPGKSGQVYALLADKAFILSETGTETSFQGYTIYLHDKGQFWPGAEMERVGLSEKLELTLNKQWEGSFQVEQKTLINKDDKTCEEDMDYSFRSCIINSINQLAGCHLDWFQTLQPKGESPPRCSSRDDILKYNKAMAWALTARWLQLTNTTGCLPRCTVRKFSFQKKSEVEITWRRNYSSAFYLDVKTTAYDNFQEFLAFDIGDTVTGIGGLLGLFLGYSLLGILQKIFKAIEDKIVTYFTD